MAKLVYGMNQSLDGYVDHLELDCPIFCTSEELV
jgi:hypothetical protein